MSQGGDRNKLFAIMVKLVTIVVLTSLLLGYMAPFVHPNTFWPIAFFGLAYPVVLILTLLLLAGFVFKLSRWSILIAVLLILGGKLHFRLLAFGSNPKDTENSEGIKLMSYNVRQFSLYDADAATANSNRLKIFSYIASLEPDVICFQEFYHHEKSIDFPTLDSLIPLLGIKDYQERYVSRTRGRKNFGISTLSKYPIIAKGEVPLQEEYTRSNANFCIFSDIVKGRDTIRVYNVHLQSIKLKSDDVDLTENEETIQATKGAVKNVVRKLRDAYQMRADQARKVVEHSLDSPYPVVICGDFNDTPLSYTYNQFVKSYVDCFRETSFGIGSTYAGKIPAGRIDYIFHSNDLMGTDFQLQDEKLSDHYAISCVIRTKDRD